ncbi:M48 family metalloprotease [Streptomyces sp. NPDC001795]|uniref:M48 family metalloprotease n=1 Tax=Streptomyces sp. NPDC001795 TaxID=3154525 RepID=UPI0033232110
MRPAGLPGSPSPTGPARLVGQRAPEYGTTIVEHGVPAVYCLSGRDARVVVTRGALDVRSETQLRAVLEHERAHIVGAAPSSEGPRRGVLPHVPRPAARPAREGADVPASGNDRGRPRPAVPSRRGADDRDARGRGRPRAAGGPGGQWVGSRHPPAARSHSAAPGRHARRGWESWR